jgi:hypothetical protein
MRGQRSKAGILYGSRPKLTAKARPPAPQRYDKRLAQIEGHAPQLIEGTIDLFYSELQASTEAVIALRARLHLIVAKAGPKLADSAKSFFIDNFIKLLDQEARNLHGVEYSFNRLSRTQQLEVIGDIKVLFSAQRH